MKVRLGHGGNCSSIGAVVDTLFASAVIGTMIFAAVSAAMANEEVTIVGKKKPISNPSKTRTADDETSKDSET